MPTTGTTSGGSSKDALVDNSIFDSSTSSTSGSISTSTDFGSTDTMNTSTGGFGTDLSTAGFGSYNNTGFGDSSFGTTSSTNKIETLTKSVQSMNDLGKIKLIDNVNSVVTLLSNITLEFIDKGEDIPELYESIDQLQEMLEVVLLNFDKYKDRIDLILSLYHMAISEYAKMLLERIDEMPVVRSKEKKFIRKVKEELIDIRKKHQSKYEKAKKEVDKKEKESSTTTEVVTSTEKSNTNSGSTKDATAISTSSTTGSGSTDNNNQQQQQKVQQKKSSPSSTSSPTKKSSSSVHDF